MTTRTCGICKDAKSVEEFSKYVDKRDGRTYYRPECKKCRSNLNAKRLSFRYHNEPGTKTRKVQYRKDNPDKVRAWRQTDYERHRERIENQTKQWARDNPAKVRQVKRKYKAKRQEWELRGSFTEQEWQDLVHKYGYKCLCCKRTDRPLTHDHVIPLSRGGSNFIENIQPLCGSCNSTKHTKTIDYRTDAA